ncbi:MAG: TetR/AcrR family transcriptional regulator [Bacteroidales bacterium]|nr:TetR/AcrR family transcriptional regulator [Bacteroidales bacterium]
MAETKHLSGDIRREQIKKAVLEIVFSEGLKKLTTKNLAKKVGLSEGAVFRHYPTKQAIILGIIDDVKNELVTKLQQISEQKNKSPEEKLEKFVCSHITYLKKNKGISIILFTEASYQNDAVLKEKLDEIFHLQKSYFTNIIRMGINSGVWEHSISPENVAALYMGIPITINIEMNLNPGKFKYTNFCRNMVILLQRILEKR